MWDFRGWIEYFTVLLNIRIYHPPDSSDGKLSYIYSFAYSISRLEKGHGFIFALQPFREFRFLPHCSILNTCQDILAGKKKKNNNYEQA